MMSTNAPPPKANLSHPCFDCGLMFANKDDYQHHENVFHNMRDKITYMPCDDCGKTFENAEDLAEHQVEHDLATLVKALCDTETTLAINRPLTEPSSTPSASLSKNNKNSAVKKKKHKVHHANVVEEHKPVVVDTLLIQRQQQMLTRQTKKEQTFKTKSLLNHSSTKRRTSDATTSTTKKIKKETPSKKSPSLTEIAKDLLKQASVIEKAASANLLRKDEPIVVDKAPQKSQMQILQPPVIPSPTSISSPSIPPQTTNPAVVDQGATGSVMLSSICPNCGENHGKPWSLIEHMIGHHGALLVRLERKYTNEMTNKVSSEIFSAVRCNYCGLDSDQLPSCLSHIVRMHREKLFECSTFGECEVCFELMSSVGNEVTKRKFTIRVKVKRRLLSQPTR